MGGRGGGGSGGGSGSGGNSNADLPLNDQGKLSDLSDKGTASEAADALGLTPDEKEHFENGADANDRRMPKPAKPGAGKKPSRSVDAGELADAHKRAVAAYARKHGRKAARAYSRGAYWSLVRAIKTTLAVASTGGQVASAPTHAAVNSALLAAYWTDKFKRAAR
ncbi:hypothetical protein CG716_05305 [Mycolicibacterium sphagni]|uniref:Uncharacterized protein n=1 Tax=Mycolicibacterium sphagni TaxID=1786 RepID=A0A255DXR2_9MYCO|nr:hypothetical protein CG716_05305 [Mycolicibacterium sphagni]